MPMNGSEKTLNERKKYVSAYNDTQVNIWLEKIMKLDVWETGALVKSLSFKSPEANSDFSEVTIEELFYKYGIFANYGVGKNTWRGNHGDIGRDNPRKMKPWFSLKHYSSVMNIREFYARNLGEEAANVISNSLTRDVQRVMLLRPKP